MCCLNLKFTDYNSEITATSLKLPVMAIWDMRFERCFLAFLAEFSFSVSLFLTRGFPEIIGRFEILQGHHNKNSCMFSGVIIANCASG